MAMEKANRWEADNLLGIPFSGIRKVSEAAAKLKAQGIDVIEMTMGRPDFDTPAHIKAAAIKALEQGKVHYTSNYGLPELRRAISKKMKEENGLEYDAGDEIIVTVGGSEAIFGTMGAFLNPGDEIIVPTPIWGNYLASPLCFGAKIIQVPVKEENGFSLLPEDVEKCITDKTKAIVQVSPGNPTGGVMKRKDQEGIAELAKKHDLLVISDEVYEHLIYTGESHRSIATLDGMRERTIVVNSFSKTYSMTGWRVGWVCADRALISSLVRTHQNIVACASSFAQYGALAALEGPQECVAEMRAEFNRRREYLAAAINKMPKVSCVEPAGAFYIFMNIKEMNMTSVEASNFFMEKAHVAIVPGSAFGEAGEGYIRIAYSASMDDIKEAVKRMDAALRTL